MVVGRWVQFGLAFVAVIFGASAFCARPDAQDEREAVRVAIANEDMAALRTTLAALARSTSVDAAADAFVEAIEAVPRNREFRARLETALAAGIAPIPERSRGRWLFVLVPGWLHVTDPETGANLARVQGVLRSLGLSTHFVPLDENGTVDANAGLLAHELQRLDVNSSRLILVSTSKGGPETHLALDRLRQEGRAQPVAAWVNIGGLLNGTAVADYWSEWPRSWLAAVGFAVRGHGTASIASMTTAARRARFAAVLLPPHVLVVNYLGVPKSTDVHSGVRDRYDLLAEDGPNDGLTLLADAIVPQGVTVVAPGLDHFLAEPRQDRIVAAMARAVLDTLEERDCQNRVSRQRW
jgi:hypothetical protein